MKGEQSGEQSGLNSIISSIEVLRQAWLDSVRNDDVERLGTLVTNDVVVVHGNGRCIRGKDELKADFRKGFEAFSIEQSVSSPEVVVRGHWAFEISEVQSKLTRQSGESTEVHSTSVVALHKQSDGSWKVGRVLGLMDEPLTR